ncbi:MAG: hypothetical protein R2854_22695 [Caldilineaceae bacterium]
MDQLPRDAAVTATAAVHPHVSHRRYVYQFPIGLDADAPELGNATWALLDVTTNTDMAPGDLKARVDAMLAADWGVVGAADGFLLLHKRAGQSDPARLLQLRAHARGRRRARYRRAAHAAGRDGARLAALAANQGRGHVACRAGFRPAQTGAGAGHRHARRGTASGPR